MLGVREEDSAQQSLSLASGPDGAGLTPGDATGVTSTASTGAETRLFSTELRAFALTCREMITSQHDNFVSSALSPTLTKHVAMVRDVHFQQRARLMADYNKQVKSIEKTFSRAVAAVYKGKVRGTRTKAPIAHRTSALDSATIATLNTSLIDHEVALKTEVRVRFDQFLEKMHPIMVHQETELGKLKLHEVHTLHEREMKRVDRMLEAARNLCMSKTKKKFFSEENPAFAASSKKTLHGEVVRALLLHHGCCYYQ